MTRPFSTRVENVSGRFPEPPAKWSYSALEAMERCPRRFALSRATYDGSSTPGYPSPPNLAALQGEAVHFAIEAIVDGMVKEGCESHSDPLIAKVINDLGGVSVLIEKAIDLVISRLEGNPRAVLLLPSIERRLRESIGKMRLQTQQLLTQVGRLPTSRAPQDQINLDSNVGRTRRLSRGSHVEQRLDAPSLSLTGIVDLLVIADEGATIVDYKTGEPSDRHRKQLMTYAVLWLEDVDRNPTGLPIAHLRAVYGRTEYTFVPVDEDLKSTRCELEEQVKRATAALETRLPEAIPDSEACPRCSVRHLCDEYWDSPFVSRRGDLIDASVTITSFEGAGVYGVRFDGRKALLGTSDPFATATGSSGPKRKGRRGRRERDCTS